MPLKKHPNINKVADKEFTMIIQQERDELFLEWLKSRDIKVDIYTGKFVRTFKDKIKEIGVKYDNQWEIRFFINKKNYAISRARAIWLINHGSIETGKMVVRISEDSYNDCIDNLTIINEVDYKSDIGKKGIVTRINNNNFTTKITLDDANEIRRMAASNEYSYQQIADKFGISKQTAMSCAFGHTWKNATEKPVEAGRSKNTVKRIVKPKIKAENPQTIPKIVPPKKLKSKTEVVLELYTAEAALIYEILERFESVPSSFQTIFIIEKLRNNGFLKISDDEVNIIIKHYYSRKK